MQPFDEHKLSTVGEAQSVAERVAYMGNFGLAHFSVGGNVLAYAG